MTDRASNLIMAFDNWLITTGRLIPVHGDLVTAVADWLNNCGIICHRMSTGVALLHPNLFSISVLWTLENGAHERYFKLGSDTNPEYQNSAIFLVYQGSPAVRRQIGPTATEDEFSILPELREGGFTDYLVAPAPYSSGTIAAVSFATKTAGGFTEEQIDLLIAISLRLAPYFEIQTLHRTSETLLGTYLGPATGKRVLDGGIKRGMCERIRAVIWFCDLRGFTALSENNEPDAVIEVLNQYLGIVTAAIEEQGGEVLKFIGDAVLAIFPLASAAAEAQVSAALHASINAHQRIDDLRRDKPDTLIASLQFGVAIHLGDVLYGNIGGVDRLDFTVIGAAVNQASRLEALTKETGEGIHLSRQIYELCEPTLRERIRNLGALELKGISGRTDVYGLSFER